MTLFCVVVWSEDQTLTVMDSSCLHDKKMLHEPLLEAMIEYGKSAHKGKVLKTFQDKKKAEKFIDQLICQRETEMYVPEKISKNKNEPEKINEKSEKKSETSSQTISKISYEVASNKRVVHKLNQKMVQLDTSINLKFDKILELLTLKKSSVDMCTQTYCQVSIINLHSNAVFY